MPERSTPLTTIAHEFWWLMLMQSILAIFFGIAAIFWPGLTLVALVYLFSAYVLIWGIIETIHGLMSIGHRDTWWMTLLFGLVGLVVGVYLVRHPDVSFTTFIALIGFTLIIRGVLDIVATFLDVRSITGRVLMVIAGAAAVLAGIVLLRQPVAGGVAFVWVLGLYAIFFGTITFAIALDTRRALERIAKP